MIFPKRKIILFFIVCLLIAVQVIGIYFIVKNEYDKDQDTIEEELTNIIQRTGTNIENNFNLLEYNLIRSDGILSNNPEFVGQKEFEDWNALDSNPILNSLDFLLWAPMIYKENLTAYNTFGQEYIHPNFTVGEFNFTTSSIQPVSERDFYLPLSLWDPPLSEGSDAILLGFDLLSFPSTAAVAQFNKTHYTSSGVSLSSGSENSKGLLFVIHVKNSGTNDTRGFVMAVFEPINFVSEALFIERNNVNLFMFDSDENVLLYHEPNLIFTTPEQVVASNNNLRTFSLFFVDRNIVVYFSFTDSFKDSFSDKNWQVILIILICSAILIDFISWASYQRYCLMRQKKELEEANKRTANEMLGYVNHELRNPLQSIMGLVDDSVYNIRKFRSELLPTPTCESSEITDGSEVARKLESVESNLITAYSSAKIMNHVMNDILDIRKLQDGRVEINKKELVISFFLLEFFKIVRPKLEERHSIIFTKDIGNIPGIIETDRYRLTQILLNLMSNAIKYTNNHIMFKIYAEQGCLIFVVADNGNGISEAKKPFIFKPFQAAKADDVSRHGGVGLGLYLCAMISERLEGKIGYYTKENVGTMFYFILPYTAEKPKPLPLVPNMFISNEIFDDRKVGSEKDIELGKVDEGTNEDFSQIENEFNEVVINLSSSP